MDEDALLDALRALRVEDPDWFTLDPNACPRAMHILGLVLSRAAPQQMLPPAPHR